MLLTIPPATGLSAFSLRRALLVFVAVLAAASGISAQTTSTTASDAVTPPALRPGAPTGSYALSGFENVNIYNGNLSFFLPLVSVGGRGGAGHTVGLPLNTKGWSVRYSSTETTQTWTPTKSGFSESGMPYGMGRLIGRKTGFGIKNTLGCPPATKRFYETTLTTLTFKAPNGTEYDLRDQQSGGQRLTVTGCPSFPYTGQSRGTVFVSADGSGATFVADGTVHDQVDIPTTGPRTFSPNGYLLLPDGTRYRITAGSVEWVRDRNGNLLTNGGFTDQLGRTVTVEYDVTDPAHGLCDRISFTGYGNTPRTIYVTKTSLGNALRPGYALQSLYQLFPELNGALNSGSGQYNPTVVSAVVLPNGRSYVFKYNSYGELARVGLPTGGAVEYDMVAGSGVVTGHNSQGMAKEIYRRVAERRVYADGATLSGKIAYDAQESAGPSYIEERDYDASGTLLGGRRHYYYNGTARHHLIREVDWTGSPVETYPHWAEGREVRTEAFAPNGASLGALLRVVNTAWAAGGTLGGFSVDPRVASVTTTLADANLVTKQTSVNPQTGALGYDQYGNRTDTWEYDFGVGAPGPLVRRTHTDYVTASAYASHTGAHLRSLPSAQQVYGVAGGVETLAAKSETLYDQYGLTPYASISGWADPQTAARGNPTTQRRWLDTTNTWLETHASYDQVGNVVSATDARGNTSTASYLDAFSDSASRNTYAFPTVTGSAVPAPSPGPYAGRGSDTPLTTSMVYDYWTGLVRSSTDANGKVTSYEYNDPLDRLKRVDRPDGGRTTYTYVDSHQCGPAVQTRTLLDATGRETDDYQFFDGLGRGVRSFKYDPQDANNPYLTSDTQYDALGRAWRVSNPYRSSGCMSAVNPAGLWTTSAYDALGRVKTVMTPDGAVVNTSYSGSTVTVTDQAGKSRRSVSDALGRLTQVVEDPNGLNYQTGYTYDALGNLRKVDQGGQFRYFMYDSLGRLLRARNPEQAVNGALNTAADSWSGNWQWSLGYSYDANSNLYQRTDARGVTTTFTYDNLDRVIRTDYSDGTPMTLHTYDFATNGRGRFYANYESSTSGMINYVHAYDAAGRPTSGSANFYLLGMGWVPGYNYSRIYDKAGHVTSQTYPSGRTVSYNYDVVGRLADNNGNAAVSGNLGDGVARTYSAGVSYDDAGRLRQERFGTQTPLYHKLHHNVRGQLYDVRLSTVEWQSGGAGEWEWNRGCLALYYGGAPHQQSSASNNGNVTMAQHWAPANDQATVYNYTQQTYAYDELNRLSSVTEQAGTQGGLGGAHGAQAYTYDRWGNRTINAGATWGAGINNKQFTVNTATNRLGVPGGQAGTMTYDAAGNLIFDSYTLADSGSRTYDAENRMTSAVGPGVVPGTTYLNQYVYDAAGKRTRLRVKSGELWQVYGFDGELLAEYGVAASPAVPRKEYGYRAGELLVAFEGVSAGPTSDVVWVEDSLPAGAQTSAGGLNEAWGWVGSNPAPASGSASNQSQVNAGLHQQYFDGASQTLAVGAGDNLVAYVYLDPANTPSEIMLQWNAPVGGWEHRAYWGANLIGWGADGTNSRRYMGPLPAAGQWVRLEVPADAVGLAGQTINGLALTLYGGRATWDRLGKAAAVGPRWLVSDNLGTPRMTVDQTGSLAGIRRHDYLPFGEEVGASIGGRTETQGYSVADNVRQKFTSKERDAETDLDYFLARYYSSSQGRFTSPDEFSGGPDELYYFVDDASANPTFYADLTRPQSLNKYQYAYNNPLRYIDPDGHEADDLDPDQQVVGQVVPVRPIAPPRPVPISPTRPSNPIQDYLVTPTDEDVPPVSVPPISDMAAPLPFGAPGWKPPTDINQPWGIPAPQPVPPPGRAQPVAPISPTASKKQEADKKQPAQPRRERSPHPPGRRERFNTKKGAEEAARRAGGGRKPVNHPHDRHGPHFHPADKKGKPLNHDHYFYPKKRG